MQHMPNLQRLSILHQDTPKTAPHCSNIPLTALKWAGAPKPQILLSLLLQTRRPQRHSWWPHTSKTVRSSQAAAKSIETPGSLASWTWTSQLLTSPEDSWRCSSQSTLGTPGMLLLASSITYPLSGARRCSLPQS